MFELIDISITFIFRGTDISKSDKLGWYIGLFIDTSSETRVVETKILLKWQYSTNLALLGLGRAF